MKAYTKGPWRVEYSPYIHIRSDDGCVLAGDYTTEANARLLTAAPELLEALKEAQQFIAKVDALHQTIYSPGLDDRCCDAIAKAEVQ